ncbi:hypothetical protein ACIQWN_06150 [Streptomyces vinaceus]|uniref:hypothetical protein n=1 Tax=Streptomyces vinaceus TaxID=1960 RepID=UPI0038048186
MKTTAKPPEGATRLPVPVGAQIRRRRLAAARCEPLPCGHRDPLDCLASPDGPSTYGLTEQELKRHAAQLIRCGWTPAEVRARLALPTREAA